MQDEACDVKPDLNSLQSSLAKGSDSVEPSQKSVGFAAELLAELRDVIHIQKHVGTPTAPNESNWPPKQSYMTFVKDFQTEEEGENADSLSEDRNPGTNSGKESLRIKQYRRQLNYRCGC